MANKHLT